MTRTTKTIILVAALVGISWSALIYEVMQTNKETTTYKNRLEASVETNFQLTEDAREAEGRAFIAGILACTDADIAFFVSEYKRYSKKAGTTKNPFLALGYVAIAKTLFGFQYNWMPSNRAMEKMYEEYRNKEATYL